MSTMEHHVTKLLNKVAAIPFIPVRCIICNIQELIIKQFTKNKFLHLTLKVRMQLTPQPFYGPFSRTTQVSQWQKKICGPYGAREN